MSEIQSRDEEGDTLVSLGNGQSQYVKLNVGGALFQTTLTTLLKHDTMLRAMFCGRMEVCIINS